ncbi:hypothetical protein P153DRAFT_77727 [Dothidotthia symphoricarpi CBS 119687]|uniref:Uncharacterized protein n=1 Tax=Dothidotthia symphoricarpi CBS 119687 TaxID=1392245 RepID=A0A6A6A4G3_9PLEO|nr:uncharacterized protein P153DRAFT_77727 [Dothidotthia symphoricarpi CBS 119687]KAF2126436.1 hypothetical protein P153DRAFT_77727 [Dothidotthia symphoricarpi CBS 119687]
MGTKRAKPPRRKTLRRAPSFTRFTRRTANRARSTSRKYLLHVSGRVLGSGSLSADPGRPSRRTLLSGAIVWRLNCTKDDYMI